MTPRLVAVLVGLVAGNFFYQSVKDTPDFSVAFERLFFEFIGAGAMFAVQMAPLHKRSAVR